MGRHHTIISVLVAILSMTIWGSARGQLALTGEVGLDLGSYRFSNTLAGVSRPYSVTRSLSNQFVSLRMNGPILSPGFANFNARARVSGTYFRMRSNEDRASDYVSPSLTNYYASLSFFPLRAYPIRLFATESRLHSIRYEPNNRSDFELQSPGLAIVRRYESNLQAQGAHWKMALAEDVHLVAEFKRDQTNVERRYDFGENRDVWVSFQTVRPDPTSPTHTVDVINIVPGDIALLFIDSAFVDSLTTGESTSIELDKGGHEVEVILTTLNPFRSQVDVQGDMTWKILFSEPAAPNDMVQSAIGGNGLLRLGGNGRFRNEAYYEFVDSDEAVQRTTNRLHTLTNTATYDLSRTANVRMLTSYTANATNIVGISSQQATALMHQTQTRWGERGGTISTLSHTFTRMNTQTDVDDITSGTHLINIGVNRPVNTHHTVDLRTAATLLSDDRGYGSNQYTADISNRFNYHSFGVKWRPRSQFKYVLNTRRNPNQTTTEWNLRFALEGQTARLGALGDLRVKGQFDWQRRSDGLLVTGKSLYTGEVGIIRRFMSRYRFMISTAQEVETFRTADGAAGSGSSTRLIRPSQRRQTYRFDLQAVPVESWSVGLGVLMVSQDGNQTTRLTASVNGRVPRVQLPIRAFLIRESRSLTGLPSQTLLEMATRIGYSFRQVRLTLTHRMVREKLIVEEYSYHEILGQVSRDFRLF